MTFGVGKLWSEFKAFAFQGNMIELAVAVIIGGAFGTVVNSLVNDVIMPSVIYAVHTTTTAVAKVKDTTANSLGISSATQPAATQPAVVAAAAPRAAAAPAPAPAPAKPEAVHIDWMIGPVNMGAFLGSLINFLLVAAAVFLMIVKLLGGVMKQVVPPGTPGEPTTRECPECLSVIPFKAKRCGHCTAVISPPTPT